MDLRSRCLLVPEPGASSNWSIVGLDGEVSTHSITADGACQLLKRAVSQAHELGLDWQTEEIRATPSAELAELVRRSRAHAANAQPEG